MKKALLVLAALVLVGGSAWYVVVMRPWTAPPPLPRATLDARWAQVRAWAALERRESGDAKLLLEAAAKLKEDGFAVADFLRDWDGARRGRAPASAAARPVPPSVEPAMALLVRWHETGGGLGPPRDPTAPYQPVDYMTLGRVGLATAGPDPSAPRRTAALHLARALRHNGRILEAEEGFLLAAEAGPPCTGPFAPQRGDVFTVLAADAVYEHDTAAALLQRPPHQRQEMPRITGRPWGVPLGVERELLMLRWYLAEVLHDAHPARDDLGRLAGWLEGQGKRELPKSLVVRVIVPAERYGDLVGRMADHLRECETGVRVERPPRY